MPLSDRIGMSGVTDTASFLSNTLKRRHQKRQEVAKVLQEGISSLHLSSPPNEQQQQPSVAHEGIYPLFNIDPESYILEEGEERSMLEPSSYHDPDFKQTMSTLLNWLNSSLSKEGIIVRSLEEDLYDGYVLAKLIDCYQPGVRLLDDDVPLSQESKKRTLENVLRYLNECFQHQQPNQSMRWTFAQIFNKDFIALLHLLLALMRLWHVKTYYQLPKSLFLKVIVVKKLNGILQTRVVHERFIDEHERDVSTMPTPSKDDLIDALFDLAPSQMASVEKTLLKFVNSHLEHYNIHLQQIDFAHFQDGLILLYLLAELEHSFLILSKYHSKKPITRDQAFANLQLAYELMNQAGLEMERYCRIQELLAGNLRGLYRLLFQLYLRYNADSNNLLQSISHLRAGPLPVDSPFL